MLVAQANRLFFVRTTQILGSFFFEVDVIERAELHLYLMDGCHRSTLPALIVAELIKSRLNRGERPGMYFWRDSNGNEVDVIIEAGDQLIPVEKCGSGRVSFSHFNPSSARILRFQTTDDRRQTTDNR